MQQRIKLSWKKECTLTIRGWLHDVIRNGDHALNVVVLSYTIPSGVESTCETSRELCVAGGLRTKKVKNLGTDFDTVHMWDGQPICLYSYWSYLSVSPLYCPFLVTYTASCLTQFTHKANS